MPPNPDYKSTAPAFARCPTVPVSVPAGRRETLLAERTGDGYRFDIRIQRERETVFFDV